MKPSPQSQRTKRFGSKDELLSAVKALTTDELWLDRLNEDKGLDRVSNAKLLRLHDVLSEVKKEFGTRTKLIAAICELDKRTKDEGYRDRLAHWPTPRLLDWYKASKKRAS